MEFWGVEVKTGESYEVDLTDGKVLHLSQACLGEIKNNKSESVCLTINVEDKKLVLGTLNSERLPQQLFDLVFDKNFTLAHSWENGSVHFYGYKADQPNEEDDDSEEIDTDEEEEALRLPLPAVNGKQEAKKEEKTVVPAKKDAGKQKVKIVEPVKDDDSDDSDSSDVNNARTTKKQKTTYVRDKAAKRRKTSSSQDMGAQFEQLNHSFKMFVQGFNANFATIANAVANAMTNDDNRQKIASEKTKDLLDELMKLNIPSGDVLQVADIFAANKEKIDIFLNLHEQLRVPYVQKLLGLSSGY